MEKPVPSDLTGCVGQWQSHFQPVVLRFYTNASVTDTLSLTNQGEGGVWEEHLSRVATDLQAHAQCVMGGAD